MKYIKAYGGITSEIETIVKIINKQTGSKVIYESEPRLLLKKLIKYYKKHKIDKAL